MKKILTCFFAIILLVFLNGCNSKTYLVTFYVNDEIIKVEEVSKNKNATAPTLEEMENENFLEGYEFIKWDQDFSKVTDNLDVHAITKEKEFEVKFFDECENEISTQTVKYGLSAKAPKDLEKTGYIFKGWDKDYRNVKEDLIIHPKFELKEFEIRYYVDNKRIYDLTPNKYSILNDGAILLPDGPIKDGYEFVGWYNDGNQIISIMPTELRNYDLYAKYQEKEKPLEIPSDMTFMFKKIKSVQHAQDPNLTVYQPDFTGLDVKAGATNYEWTSLQPNIATISAWSSISVVNPGYAIIRATLKSDKTVVGYAVIKVNADGVFISSIEEANQIRKYTVTFTDEVGNIIDTQEVEEYKMATLPTPPKKEGYTFTGWSGEHFNIKENITLEPTYRLGESDYLGKSVSIIGDSITTYKSYIPNGYSSFYPYPTADVKDVNQTWWMQVINSLGMKLLKNNSYAGTCVAEGTGNFGTTNITRLKNILDNDKAPDIILIYMGANDCGSGSISDNNFQNSYKIMLNNVKTLAPNAKVYLINLPYSKMYDNNKRIRFNNIIKEISTLYNYPLLDIKDTFMISEIDSYLVDSVHPNKRGMKAMSDKIIADLLKLKGIE